MIEIFSPDSGYHFSIAITITIKNLIRINQTLIEFDLDAIRFTRTAVSVPMEHIARF
jgi:hypothetical protein